MGHEANYVLRRGGRTQIFYSPWGAISLAEDIFWGPEETTRFARTFPAAEQLLEPAACGGAALIDWDRRRLTWFESGDGEQDPAERRLYAQLLRQTWPGWEIRSAEAGILTLATELGLDIPEATAAAGSPLEIGKPVAAPKAREDFVRGPPPAEPQAAAASLADVPTCLAPLVTRLLDEERWDPRAMFDGIHRDSRHARVGCSCLLVLVTLGAVAVATWLRTIPALVGCVLVVLAVLIPAVRVWRRSTLLFAVTDGMEVGPQPAGPSLPKKRSILDQALTRLGYPTTEQLEQAGLLVSAADAGGEEDELPDRFGPLRPVRADEIAGVVFYRIRLSRLRLRELRRGASLWQACLLKYLAPIGWYDEAIIPVPRAERLIPLTWNDLPSHVQRQMEPWRRQAADSGFAAEFLYTLPMLGRQEGFGLALCDAAGLIVVSLLYARIRIRLAPDEDPFSDEELFEVALTTVLPDNRLLVTQRHIAELDPPPNQEVRVFEEGEWPELLAMHQRRMEAPDRAGLQRVKAADLPALLLQWNHQEVDYHLARGVYQRMTRADIDRFAEDG